MKMEDMVIVSVDDHIVEPAGLWDNALSAQHKHLAPKMIRGEDGADYWLFEGKRAAQGGLNAVVGRPKEEYGMEPISLDQMRKGVYDIHARVDDMNVNGILASVNFPSILSFDGGLLHRLDNKDNARILCEAYNDWHIDDWCGAYPGRSIPLAMVPYWDMQATSEEIARVAKKGCHAITFSDNPVSRGHPSIHDDFWKPLWKACADHDMVINIHIGTGAQAPHASMASPIDAWITTMPISIVNSAADWLNLDALHDYPLKIVLSEGGIGWIPYFLERATYVKEHHSAWTHGKHRGRAPIDVFREHFLTCFVEDKFGLQNIDAIGEDNISYECDYPHSDTQWPRVPEHLWETIKHLTDVQIDKITHENALKFYNFDAIGKMGGRENCTVSALRAKATHVDVGEVALEGAAPVAAGAEPRRVTSGDIVSMMARINEKSELNADA
ncbi:MAG TPA: amidohydrolase family protein [Novosphingobium sp.]|nr:amidohydrolase family protein [Novosphingobium sp.]